MGEGEEWLAVNSIQGFIAPRSSGTETKRDPSQFSTPAD